MANSLNPMNTTTFLSFAPEIFQAIGEELDVKSLKGLRLACKHLANTLGPTIRRSVTIDLNQSTIQRDMPKLRAFAVEDGAFSQDTREITIRGLSPTYDPSYQGELWEYIETSATFVRADDVPEIPTEALQAEEELKQSLLHSLTSLKGVHKLTWTPIRKDKDWAHSIVVDVLKNLPNLRTLKLRHQYCRAPLNLEEIQGLHSIIIENAGESGEELFESLAKTVARSPQLTSVDILPYRNWGNPTPVTHSLHHLFKYYPEKTSPLRLHHLGLHGCLLRLDDITMPHLLSLKSLRLTSHVDPSAPPPPRHRPVNGSDEQKRVGSSEADVWKTLETTGIRLELINHDMVTAPFLDYISTCSGLKKLDLALDSYMFGSESTNQFAVRFFKKSLLEHVQTLEELSIAPHYEGDWSFSSDTISAISACVNLKKLGVAIISSELENQQQGFQEKGKVDAIKCLVDMAVACLPRLEIIAISISDEESSRDAICGNGSMDHKSYTRRAITNSIKTYTAPTTCQRLPTLVVTGGYGMEAATFIGKRENEDDGLIYVSDE